MWVPLLAVTEVFELSEQVVMLVSCETSDASSPSKLITSGSCENKVSQKSCEKLHYFPGTRVFVYKFYEELKSHIN
jgi:hypothetical protein